MTEKKVNAFDLPEPPKGVSKNALSVGYIIAVSVSMVLALSTVIQFFGGNSFNLENKEQESAFQVVNKLIDQNDTIIKQNQTLIESLKGISTLEEIEKRLDALDARVANIILKL